MCLLSPGPETLRAGDYALTVYGGQVTEDKWFESLPPGVNFVHAYILVGALSRTLRSCYNGALTLEIEGQVAKYYGDQHHLEFNLPVAVRWHDFGWDSTVDTSAAFGLGPSWAAVEPAVEVRIHGTTQKFLVYWFAEVALGPPGRDWALVFRLHHRSKAFGLVADEGGANTLAAGIRFLL